MIWPCIRLTKCAVFSPTVDDVTESEENDAGVGIPVIEKTWARPKEKRTEAYGRVTVHRLEEMLYERCVRRSGSVEFVSVRVDRPVAWRIRGRFVFDGDRSYARRVR
jgi:hypothetical protein